MIHAGPARTTQTPAATEHELAATVLDTLLREDYGGLSGWVRSASGGPALHLPTGAPGLVLPLEPDGFLAGCRIRRPAPAITLDDVCSVLNAVHDPRDRDGVTDFLTECRQALAALRLRERHLPAVRAALAADGPAAWLGPAGQLRFDALAAARPHPAYPTAACRSGVSDSDALAYAPEYRPGFELTWVAVPRTALVTGRRDRPPWWPSPPDVGLPGSLASTHDLLPVHPLTARAELARALAETGLAEPGRAESGQAEPGMAATIAPRSHLRVTPTLSTRTVAVARDPGVHLKLPLPISTLGRRNRRSIVPGTLADGALVRAVTAAAVAGGTADAAAEGDLGSLLLADEASYAHAGHPYLGYLLRRLPAGLERCHVVPLAALLAPAPLLPPAALLPPAPLADQDPLIPPTPVAAPAPLVAPAVLLSHTGPQDPRAPVAPAPSAPGPPRDRDREPLVIGELARGYFGGDLPGLLDAYFRLVFGTQVDLFVRYGIALEAHQQNAALVLGPGPRTLRLLVKDFDGALIHHPRLVSALGPAAPGPSAFADDRLLTGSDDALADVFITITVHLCAGALAFGLAERGVAARSALLALARDALAGALDRHAGSAPAARLRARVLEADRLPGKSMVTAGTLADKARTGARDINKFYGTTGPNYLKGGRR